MSPSWKDSFLSRRVPHESTPSLLNELMPLIKLIEELKSDGKPYSDHAFGNPHDPPLAKYAQVLKEQVSKVAEENCSPSLLQYQRDFVSEKQAILASLQERRGSSYSALTTNHIFVTNGAFGGLMMAMKTFANVGDAFVTVIPEYFGYQGMIDGLECSTITVPLSPENDFDLDVPAIAQVLRDNHSKARILLITSPNNPSGQMYTSQKLQELADALRAINQEREDNHNLPPIILLSDEAYHRIIFPSTNRPYVSPASFYEYTISIYSYAKTCMAPSERLGWLVLSPLWPSDFFSTTIRALNGAQISTGWLSPSASLARCIPVLEGRENINDESNSNNDNKEGVRVDLEELERRRDELVKALQTYPTLFPQVVVPQSGFYLLFRVPDTHYPDKDWDFVDLLAHRYRIVGMHGSVLNLNGWVRLSVTASPDMIQHTCQGIHAYAADQGFAKNN